MADKENDFKGLWIPKEIWDDGRLKLIEKAILALIVNLDTGDGCYASNAWIAEFCGCTQRTVTNAVARLASSGRIKVLGYDGRKRHIKQTTVEKFSTQTGNNFRSDTKNLRGRLENSSTQTGNSFEQNKYNNNIYNNISINTTAVMQRLEEKSGRRQILDEAAKRLIAKRANEGYTEEDFIAVIDKKCREWYGTDFEMYLRPSTLFGDKFGQYLTTPERINRKTDVQPENSSFDTDTMFIRGLRKSYASDEEFERHYPEYKGKY